ncbi:MAG: efflux RND transporter permease subunit, partial [Sphingomonadales bacterium]
KVKDIQTQLPPHVQMKTSWDSSLFVEEAIFEVYRTLFISMALVIFVIYLFLGSFRAAIIPAITVPVSLIATFWVLGLAGYSINMITLLALVLTIGLVVDDSIVVLENCYRRVEKGEPALLAAYRGARQVAFAVIATTVVLISVFLPIFFVEGTIATIFKELALTVTAAVGFSSFIALSLSAMLCSKLLSRKEKKGWLRLHLITWFETINKTYDKVLRTAIGNKAGVGVIFVGSLVLVAGFFLNIQKELAPAEDRGAFWLNIRGPEGAGFEAMSIYVKEVEDSLMGGVEDGTIQTLLINLPGFRARSESVNTADGILILPSWKIRDKNTSEMVSWARGQVAEITDVFPFFRESSAFSTGGGAPVQFVIGANTYAELAEIRDRMLERIDEYPGLVNVDTDYQETQPQIRIDVDRDRAADIGVSVAAIGRTLETMLAGRRVTTYVDRGEEYNVMLQAAQENRTNPADIDNIFVRSQRTGQLVPLSNLVTVRNVADSGRLNRYNRVRALTISAGLGEGYTLGQGIEFMLQTALEVAPEAVYTDLKGDSREFDEMVAALGFTFGLALLVVFLVLAGQFESFIHPITIMITVPLAIAGGLFGLYVTGNSLNIYSAVGLIILIGIAAKNGILIVEFANQLRDEGQSVTDAIVNGAKIRLRPVVMTGISTAAGSLPLVLAIGPGSESRSSIGVIVLFGVIIATFFTLILIPVFYDTLGKYTGSPGFIERKLRLQEKDISSKK